jgi:heme oxygenase (mycobilin-producing)
MSTPVILINSFVVHQGKEEEFIKRWKETAQVMKEQPGFIDTKLHRSLDPNAKFQFINVAHWESAEAWQAATSTIFSKAQAVAEQLELFEHYPALYQIEVEY